MRRTIPYLLFFLIILPGGLLYGQENYFDSLLTEEVKVENPVYKPVVGLGYGAFSFIGDVKDPNWSFFSGNPGVRLTVSTYLDKNHYYKLDFNLLSGSLSANQGTEGNHLNFFTDLTAFGVGVHYGFAHLYKKNPRVFPFVGVGIETFRFNSKGDLFDAGGNRYRYLPDGTIRNETGMISSRDFVYESDLRKLNLYGSGNYTQMGFAVPVDMGMEALLSKRVMLRAGISLHITNTDLIDNVNKASGVTGAGSMTDMFTFTYITLHLDLFSEPEYVEVQKLFADYETDETLLADEDNDWVLDFGDQCPASPPGVEVDSLGCPIDSDHDGIPNYLDKELRTPAGNFVDDQGRLLPDTTFAKMLDSMKAINRSELNYYIGGITSSAGEQPGISVPLKFREFDQNKDDYISFTELLNAVDKYFDYRTFLSLQDIYEFIEFYFSQ